MYKYTGNGIMVGIDYEDNGYCSVDETSFVNAFNYVFSTSYSLIEEIDNDGRAGSWNSPDNTDEATLNGDEVYGVRGIVIATQESAIGNLERVLFVLGRDAREFSGDVHLSCFQ